MMSYKVVLKLVCFESANLSDMDQEGLEGGEQEEEEVMDTTTSQFSQFTDQYDSWYSSQHSSDLCEVPQSQDTVMSSDNDLFQVISQSSADFVRVPSECLAGPSSQESNTQSTNTQSTNTQSTNTQSDADYIPGTKGRGVLTLFCVHCSRD